MINNTLNKTHKKNNTTNIGKILEEIEKKKINKIKITNDKKNKSILKKLKNKNHRNINQYKISSKTLTKSLKIKIDNKSNINIVKN